jgi:hypothetical protein
MEPIYNAQTWGTHASIYELLLTHSAPLKFPSPWDFVPAQPQCVGPVTNPTAVLAELLSRYDEGTLREAGVLSPAGKSGPQLSPLFTSSDAALIALRNPCNGPLVGLLTAQGCFPARNLLTIVVLTDYWTRKALSARGNLFLSPDIHEVALLRALGMPATLSLDLPRLPAAGLHFVDDHFMEYPEGGLRAKRPSLALVGWSPMKLNTQLSPALLPALEHLTQARQYLGLNLRGVWAWRLSADSIANLHYRAKLRDVQTVQALLVESTEPLYDIATLLPPGGVATATDADPGSAYTTARAELLVQLSDAPAVGSLPERAGKAKELYDEIVQHKLIEPLQKWALSSSDPVLRSAGLELATVCQLLHRMGPLLLSLQARQYDRALVSAGEPLPDKVLSQYLALVAQMGNLIRDLCRWMTT